MINTLKWILLISLFLMTISCKSDNKVGDVENSQFISSKWKVQDGRDYPYRPIMLQDLVDSKLLKGKTEDELYELLGNPSRKDKEYRFYQVEQKRLQFFPLHTTTLVVVLDSMNIVDKVLIHK